MSVLPFSLLHCHLSSSIASCPPPLPSPISILPPFHSRSRTHTNFSPSLRFSPPLHRPILKLSASATHSSSHSDLPGSNYEFRDDDADVEVRVQLPDRGHKVSASNVFVDAQDTSLSIVLELPTGYTNLFPAARLYGRIKPAETVWYVDEDEIVLSLKKSDPDIAWPGLFEAWEALTVGVSKLLKSISVYIVGESTEINQAVARELAEGLQYVPLQTSQLLEQLTKNSLENMLVNEGEEAVADAEAMILSSLNTHVRLVVGTLGESHGAASRQGKWNNLHAGISIWLSQSKAIDETSAEEEAIKAKKGRK